jgi:hypothetical protein
MGSGNGPPLALGSSGENTLPLASYDGQIAGHLQEYQQKGAAEAQKHRPSPDAVHPDANEVALRTEAERFVATEQRAFNEALGEASKTNAEIHRKLFDAEAEVQLALSDSSLSSSVDAELAADKQQLVRLVEDRIDAEVDLRAFRARNGITDPPNYPESQIYHFAIVAAFMLGETIVNAFFYQNEGGLLGGAVVALAVSFLNMASAAFLGIGFRYKNLNEPLWKVAGWSCFALFVLSAIYFNALFATFRSEYQFIADPSDAFAVSQAFRKASDEAFRVFVLKAHFADMMSFLLFGIGIILSIVAFRKGYTADDPVPQHSRKDKRLKAAVAAEAQKRDLIRQRLKDFLLDRRTRLQSLSSEPTVLVAVANGAVAKVKQAVTALKTSTASIQRDYALVLDAYRQSNLSVRGIDPPAYFGTKPNVVEAVDTSPSKPVTDELSEVISQLEAHRERFKQPLNAALNQLQNDMADILDSRFDAFVDEVTSEAKSNLKKRNVILDGEGIA